MNLKKLQMSKALLARLAAVGVLVGMGAFAVIQSTSTGDPKTAEAEKQKADAEKAKGDGKSDGADPKATGTSGGALGGTPNKSGTDSKTGTGNGLGGSSTTTSGGAFGGTKPLSPNPSTSLANALSNNSNNTKAPSGTSGGTTAGSTNSLPVTPASSSSGFAKGPPPTTPFGGSNSNGATSGSTTGGGFGSGTSQPPVSPAGFGSPSSGSLSSNSSGSGTTGSGYRTLDSETKTPTTPPTGTSPSTSTGSGLSKTLGSALADNSSKSSQGSTSSTTGNPSGFSSTTNPPPPTTSFGGSSGSLSSGNSTSSSGSLAGGSNGTGTSSSGFGGTPSGSGVAGSPNSLGSSSSSSSSLAPSNTLSSRNNFGSSSGSSNSLSSGSNPPSTNPGFGNGATSGTGTTGLPPTQPPTSSGFGSGNSLAGSSAPSTSPGFGSSRTPSLGSPTTNANSGIGTESGTNSGSGLSNDSTSSSGSGFGSGSGTGSGTGLSSRTGSLSSPPPTGLGSSGTGFTSNENSTTGSGTGNSDLSGSGMRSSPPISSGFGSGESSRNLSGSSTTPNQFGSGSTNPNFGSSGTGRSLNSGSGLSSSGANGLSSDTSGLRNSSVPSIPASSSAGINGSRIGADNVADTTAQNRPGPVALEGAQTPALVIEKRAPAEVQVGQEAEFILVVRNTGNVVAERVRVVDRVPQGAEFNQSTPQPTSETDGVLVWSLGRMAPGEEKTIEMRITPMQTGEIGSVAEVHFQAQASVKTVVTQPKLSITKTSPAQVTIGEEVIVGLKVRNDGNGIAKDVMVETDVSEHLSHPVGRDLKSEIGTLGPGEFREIQLVLDAKSAGVVNQPIVVTGQGGLVAREALDLEVIAPQLRVSMAGPTRRFLDRQAIHKLEMVNNGTAPATNVVLMAQLPAGLDFVECDSNGSYDPQRHAVYWELSELPINQKGTVRLVTVPTQTGELAIDYKVTADLNQLAQDRAMMVVQESPELFFEIDDKADHIEVGSETEYVVRVTNQGSKAATDIRVGMAFANGIRPTEVEGTIQYQIQGQNVIFSPIRSLAAGEEVIIKVRGDGVAAGDHRVAVEVSSAEAPNAVMKEENTTVYADQ